MAPSHSMRFSRSMPAPAQGYNVPWDLPEDDVQMGPSMSVDVDDLVGMEPADEDDQVRARGAARSQDFGYRGTDRDDGSQDFGYRGTDRDDDQVRARGSARSRDFGYRGTDRDNDQVRARGAARSRDFGYRGTDRSFEVGFSPSPTMMDMATTMSHTGMMASPYMPVQARQKSCKPTRTQRVRFEEDHVGARGSARSQDFGHRSTDRRARGAARSEDFGYRGTDRSFEASFSRSQTMMMDMANTMSRLSRSQTMMMEMANTMSHLGMMASPYMHGLPGQTEIVPPFPVAPHYYWPSVQEQLAQLAAAGLAGQGWNPDAWSRMMPGGEPWYVDDMGEMSYTGTMYSEDRAPHRRGRHRGARRAQETTQEPFEVSRPWRPGQRVRSKDQHLKDAGTGEGVDDDKDRWNKEESWRLLHRKVLREQIAAKKLEEAENSAKQADVRPD